MIAHGLQQPTRSVLVEVGTSRCLFGLAPAGVYPAASVASRAVSSYLTFSPLPLLAQKRSQFGGVFSVALSVAGATEVVDAQVLPGNAPNGARTFLERHSKNTARDYPVGNL